jgi:hypothetical protein
MPRRPKNTRNTTCLYCEIGFVGRKRRHAKFCGPACKQAWYRLRQSLRAKIRLGVPA